MIQNAEPKKGRPTIHPQATMWTITTMMTPKQADIMRQITSERGSKSAAIRFLIEQYRAQRTNEIKRSHLK